MVVERGDTMKLVLVCVGAWLVTLWGAYHVGKWVGAEELRDQIPTRLGATWVPPVN